MSEDWKRFLKTTASFLAVLVLLAIGWLIWADSRPPTQDVPVIEHPDRPSSSEPSSSAGVVRATARAC